MSNRRKGVFDPGAVSPFAQEHQEAERLALAARSELQATIPVIIAPDDLSIRELIRWVNDECEVGDYLISLHLNSSDNRLASGTECLYAATASPKRKLEAQIVAATFSDVAGLRNRGAKSDLDSHVGRLPILRNTRCPALLLEAGFVSNRADVAALRQDGAEALVAAIQALKEIA
jgi:N-acetylmuramoyl-L-alanine amidase